MKKITKGQKWNGKIHYRDFAEEIQEPANVEQKICQGAVFLDFYQILIICKSEQ